METFIERTVGADPMKIYGLAAAVEDWPRILPHYRWVRVLSSDRPDARVVDMAARRDVVGRLGIPLRWTAVQRLYPREARIEFDHVGGVTRGMRVEWTIRPGSLDASTVIVRIRHVFQPSWPVPDRIVQAVLGEYFVNGVARRTLGRIAELAQRPS